MIIKNNSAISKRKSGGKILKYVGIVALLAVLVYCFSWVTQNITSKGGIELTEKDFIIYADAENVKKDQFVKGEFTISRGYQQSSDFAYSGNYSCKLSAPNAVYGLTLDVPDLRVGDNLVVRAWVRSTSANSPGCVCIKSLDKKTTVYIQSCDPIASDGEWQLVEARAQLLEPVEGDVLRIFCFNNTNQPVYFDDLRFYKDNKPIKVWEPEKIHLVIKEGEYNKLKNIRKEALGIGILMTTEDSWVKGAIFPASKEDTKTKVSLRLKGDWLDHLRGDKWSFRVKTEATKSWNRLKTFSLQDPHTRSYLKEWLLHQLFDYEDILTTRYDFVDVKINHEEKGVYVYEEHFMKQIPEYNLRREGPIVKFTENGLWEDRFQADRLGVNMHVNANKANPDIRPFGEGKTKKSPNLSKQFALAQNLCYEYKYGLKPVEEIFDVDLLAKYYAIMDITGSHHGVIWHNQRFYYNPIIGKLEPIGFDGYDEYGTTWVKKAFIGYNQSNKNRKHRDWHIKLFLDPVFLKKYYFYLDKFSNKNYITKFLSEVSPELNNRLRYLRAKVPGYQFNTDFIYERAANIKAAILPNSSSLHTRTVSKGRIAMYNGHTTPVEVIGYASAKGGLISRYDTSVMVYTTPGYALPDYTTEAIVGDNANFLVYKVAGLEELYYTEISPWPIPEAYTPMQELKGNLVEDHPAYYYDKENRIVVFKDSALITEHIIVPKDHLIKVDAGTYIDISNKAFVISYSAVEFSGNEEEPILVNSSDGTANGFTVIKAKEQSFVRFTTFQNMNTLAYKGWNLTGAVTFYESNVEVHNSVFTKNSCEDALNIVRSEFLFDKSTVSHTFSDGFDADFCTGTVRNGTFIKTGNDGIDFSTSKIVIADTRIENVGDKGISIGEQGTAVVRNTTIDGAVIGIASKDLSNVTVESATLKNCDQGFAAYQKKPEYGGGKIIVKQYSGENLKMTHKIFPGSYLKLVDKEIKGN